MHWSEVVAELNVAAVDGRTVRQQALVLLWAISRTRRGLPGLVAWTEARNELIDLLAKHGGSTTRSEHPFVALAQTGLWELSEPAPPARGVDVLTWLDRTNPLGGLSGPVEAMVRRDSEDTDAAFEALLARFVPDEDAKVLLAALEPQWDGFGWVPGVPFGAIFESRQAAAKAKVHRSNQAGICGTKVRGCESIAVAGGYEDDIDDGDVIIYTGEGGQDKRGRQVADQELTTRNASLITSFKNAKPVRVLRRVEGGGYIYSGLYLVKSYWQEKGRSGHLVWRYELRAMEVEAAETFTLPVGDRTPRRRMSAVERIMRSMLVAESVKQIHEFECQIGGEKLATPLGLYAETAHIKPLGRPHNGPDTPENALCLCPNHHKLFDLGALVIDDDRMVVDVMNDEAWPLREVEGHRIDLEFAAYHRTLHPMLDD